jgi:hypothetical protein
MGSMRERRRERKREKEREREGERGREREIKGYHDRGVYDMSWMMRKLRYFVKVL